MNSNGNIYNIFSTEGFDIMRFRDDDANYLNSLYSPTNIAQYKAADM